MWPKPVAAELFPRARSLHSTPALHSPLACPVHATRPRAHRGHARPGPIARMYTCTTLHPAVPAYSLPGSPHCGRCVRQKRRSKSIAPTNKRATTGFSTFPPRVNTRVALLALCGAASCVRGVESVGHARTMGPAYLCALRGQS
jgi:hypothetical protein